MKQSLGFSILRVIAKVFVVLFHSLGYYTHAWPFDGIKINTDSSFDIVLNQITMPTFFLPIGIYDSIQLWQEQLWHLYSASYNNLVGRTTVFPATIPERALHFRSCLHFRHLFLPVLATLRHH